MRLSGSQEFVLIQIANKRLPTRGGWRSLRALQDKGFVEFVDVILSRDTAGKEEMGGEFRLTEKGMEKLKEFAVPGAYWNGDSKKPCNWTYPSLVKP